MDQDAASSSERAGQSEGASDQSISSIPGCPPIPGVIVEKFPGEVFVPKCGTTYHTHWECHHSAGHVGMKRNTHCTVCARNPDQPMSEALARATVLGNPCVCYICGGHSRTPFAFCGSCGRVQSFHHHSCCPAHSNIRVANVPPANCWACTQPIHPSKNRIRCARCHNFLHLTCVPAHEAFLQGTYLAN